MKRSYIKQLVQEELENIKTEAAAKVVNKGTVTDGFGIGNYT